jgi:single-strand DNA-binding protein
MNKFIGIGRLIRDPELKYTPNGTAVCEFSVALNEVWKDSNGVKKEEVTFIDCVAWRGTAETIVQYFHKGKMIAIEGKLKNESWVDSTTQQKRYRTKVTISKWEFCGDKADDRPRSYSSPGSFNGPPVTSGPPTDIDDSEVPF